MRATDSERWLRDPPHSVCTGILPVELPSMTPAHRAVLIIALGYRPNIGGLETHLDDLTSYLAGQGVEVDVHTLQPITTPFKGPRLERRAHLTIHRYGWVGQGWFYQLARVPVVGFLYSFPAMLMVAMRARRNRAEIVYPQGLAAAAASALVFPRRRRCVALHSDIGFSSPLARRTVRGILTSADAVLCLSERVCSQVGSLGIPPERVHRFRYWVDVKRFQPALRTSPSIAERSPGKFTVLFVGRLIPEKGVRLALDAARTLADGDVEFLFAGTGPEERHIREFHGETPVRYLGAVTQDALPALYSSADVLLVPSPSQEGFGRVILEAMACGTAIIAARRGGIPEVVTPDIGLLVEPDVGEIVDAIRRLRSDPDTVVRMGAAARTRALAEYSDSNAEMILRRLFP